MPSVEERLRYWRTRAQRMQVALEDIATDEVQSHSDDELGLIQRMQDTARGVLGDDPSEFDALRATISTLTAELDALKRERDEAREAARQMHRRAQQSERAKEIVVGTLKMWLEYFQSSKRPRKERYLFKWALREIDRRLSRSALSAANAAEREG